MNDQTDIEHALHAWFGDGPSEMPDRVVYTVADRISRQPQRHTWRLQRRLPMNRIMTMAAGAAAVLVAGAVGFAVFGRPSEPTIGGPVASPSSSPTTFPSSLGPSASPQSSVEGVVYTTSSFEVPISFRLVDGFAVDREIHDGLALTHPSRFSAGIGSLASIRVAGPTPDAPALPWPSDLEAWLGTQSYLTFGYPRPIEVGGRPGTWFAVQVKAASGKPTKAFVWSGGSWAQLTTPEAWMVMEVKTRPGQGLVVLVGAPPEQSREAKVAIDRLLGTLEFVDTPSQ